MWVSFFLEAERFFLLPNSWFPSKKKIDASKKEGKRKQGGGL